MRMWKSQTFLWKLGSWPKGGFSLYLDCIMLFELWWWSGKGFYPCFLSQSKFPVNPCWSFLWLILSLHWRLTFCLLNHVLTSSFPLQHSLQQLILNIYLPPQQQIQFSLHQIVFFIPSKLPLSNIIPVQILLHKVQVSCKLWIMLGSTEIVADEMFQKFLSTKSLWFL